MTPKYGVYISPCILRNLRGAGLVCHKNMSKKGSINDLKKGHSMGPTLDLML